MSTGVEVDLVAEWLYTTLSADSTLAAAAPGGMHEIPAPQGTAYPLVGFNLHDDHDVAGVGVTRVLTRQEWIVRGIVEGESYDRTIAERIDTLLEDVVAAEADAGVTVTCVRLKAVRYPETHAGKQYRHLGGRYLIIAHSTA